MSWKRTASPGFLISAVSIYLSAGPTLAHEAASAPTKIVAGPLALDSTSREFVGRVIAVINPLGRLAALLSVALAGSLVSTVLRGFHASVLGISFGPVDTVFTGFGLLAVMGGIYTRVSLRDMIARPMPSSGEPSPGLTGAEGGTKP